MPPESGISPILQNAWMKLADFVAIDDVAGERDVGARAGRDAVDGAHDRQRQVRAASAPAAGSCVSIDVAEVDRRAARAPPRDRPGPGPRRSRAPRRSAAARAPRRRPLTRSSASRSSCVHRVGEAVEPVGPVERDARDAVAHVEQDGFVGHALRHASGAARRGSGSRRTPRRSALRSPRDSRRCRGNPRTPPTG